MNQGVKRPNKRFSLGGSKLELDLETKLVEDVGLDRLKDCWIEVADEGVPGVDESLKLASKLRNSIRGHKQRRTS